jgi:hypothetical protein
VGQKEGGYVAGAKTEKILELRKIWRREDERRTK